MNKSSIKTSIQIIHNPISLIRLKETFKTKTENKPQGGGHYLIWPIRVCAAKLKQGIDLKVFSLQGIKLHY